MTEQFIKSDENLAPLPVEEIITPVHLEELRLMPDILPTLLKTFRSDVSHSIDLIQTAIVAVDPEAMAKAAHGIAGSAGSVGGHRLTAICRQLESNGRAGSVEGADTLLPVVEAEYKHLCYALESVAAETN